MMGGLRKELFSLRASALIILLAQFFLCAFCLDALGFIRIGAFPFTILAVNQTLVLPHLQSPFLIALNVSACCVGLILAVLQIRSDRAQGMWPILLTRPIGRAAIFAGKAAAGVFILIAALGAPLLFCTWMSLLRRSFASPFSWELLLPAFASILRGVCVYLICFYYSFAPHRNFWAVICSILAAAFVLLMSAGVENPPLGDGFRFGVLLTLAVALFFVSAAFFNRKTFLQWSVSPPDAPPAPWFATAFVAFMLTIIPGGVLEALSGMFGSSPEKQISVNAAGAIRLVSPGRGFLANVFDTGGHPAPEAAGPWPYEIGPSTIRLDRPISDLSERYFLNTKGSGVPMPSNLEPSTPLPDDWNWFLEPGENRIVAYDPGSRERIGWLVPGGFHYEPPVSRFPEIDDRTDYMISLAGRSRERLLAAGDGIYRVGFYKTNSFAQKLAAVPGTIRRIGAGMLRFDRLSEQGTWIAVMTDSELIVMPLRVDPGGTPESVTIDTASARRTKFPVGELSLADALRVVVLDDGGVALYRGDNLDRADTVWFFDGRGQVRRQAGIPYDSLSYPILDDIKWLQFPAWIAVGFVVDRFTLKTPVMTFFEDLDDNPYGRAAVVYFIGFAVSAMLFRFYFQPRLVAVPFPYLTILLFNVWGLWALCALNHREPRSSLKKTAMVVACVIILASLIRACAPTAGNVKPAPITTAELQNRVRVIRQNLEDESLKRALVELERRIQSADLQSISTELDVVDQLAGAWDLYTNADYVKAEQTCRQVLARDTEQAQALELMGRIENVLDNYEDAQKYAGRALDIRIRKFGYAHPDVARSLSDSAAIYLDSLIRIPDSRYSEAETVLVRAVSVAEKALGPDHPDVARTLYPLARMYYLQGNYDTAEGLYKRQLEICKTYRGPEHHTTAGVMARLAQVYHAQLRDTDAEELYRESLRLTEKSLGPSHPYVADRLHTLAQFYYDKNRFPEAEPLYKRSLSIRESRLPQDEDDVMCSLYSLAGTYYAQSRYAEAQPLYERALEIAEKKKGPGGCQCASALEYLGDIYVYTGQYDKAEPIYLREIEVREKSRGSDDLAVARALYDLGIAYQHLGYYGENNISRVLRWVGIRRYGAEIEYYEKSADAFQRALSMAEKNLGHADPFLADILQRLGWVYHYHCGKSNQAEPLYNRAIAILNGASDTNQNKREKYMDQIAEMYRDMGRTAESDSYASAAKEIREKIGRFGGT